MNTIKVLCMCVLVIPSRQNYWIGLDYWKGDKTVNPGLVQAVFLFEKNDGSRMFCRKSKLTQVEPQANTRLNIKQKSDAILYFEDIFFITELT